MTSDSRQAFWAAQADEADARDKADDLRGTTPEQRGEILVALCRMASEQIAWHPDPERALRWQDPLSPETEALLRRLRREHG